MAARIVVVDDEPGMQLALREVLVRQGHQVCTAGDAMSALEQMENQPCDLLITDVRMPEVTGIELLERVRRSRPEVPVLVMTAYGTIEDAVEAMKKGAADYLLKPFSSDTIEEIVSRLLRVRPTDCEGAEASEGVEPGPAAGLAGPIAISPLTRQIFDLAHQVADSVATILIQGESGTGKEVVARFIHQDSGRRDRPFVAVNCAALPENLLESELFGHEKGAFTGAVLARKGKFELANHGTLLLDEVSEIPLALQAKLLRVLQEREIDPIGAQRPVPLDVRVVATTNRNLAAFVQQGHFREIDPIGAQRPVPLDVRVVATTNRNLAAFVQQGHFREDLFYRLQVITVDMPALRERREDILPLSEHFVHRHCRVNRRPRKRLSAAMREYLYNQPWRGNIRELENFLERAVLLCQADEITPDNIHLAGRTAMSASQPGFAAPATAEPSVGQRTPPPPVPVPLLPPGCGGPVMTLEEMEKQMILQTLDRVGGNRTKAADLLGVSVRTIRNKLNLYGIAVAASEENRVAAGV